MKSPAASSMSSTVVTCVVIVAYLGLNAGLNMTNKWALGIYGFRFPLLLTSCHMAFCFFVLAPFMAREPFRSKHHDTVQRQWRGLLMMGLFMAANISLNNLSLTLISLSLNQVIRCARARARPGSLGCAAGRACKPIHADPDLAAR